MPTVSHRLSNDTRTTEFSSAITIMLPSLKAEEEWMQAETQQF